MPRSPQWPRSLVRRFGRDYQLARATRDESGTDTVWNFQSREQLFGFIRTPDNTDADDFSIGELGAEDNIFYVIDVLEMGERSEDARVDESYVTDPPMEADDRVITEQGTFRVVDPVFAHQNGFSRYALKDDGRGQSQDNSNDSGGSEDDPPYTIS